MGTVRLLHQLYRNDATFFFYEGEAPVKEGVLEIDTDERNFETWVRRAYLNGYTLNPDNGEPIGSVDDVLSGSGVDAKAQREADRNRDKAEAEARERQEKEAAAEAERARLDAEDRERETREANEAAEREAAEQEGDADPKPRRRRARKGDESADAPVTEGNNTGNDQPASE